MSKRQHRRFTAEQKLEILREADQPGVTVSVVPAPRIIALGVLSTVLMPLEDIVRLRCFLG
jgi:hypothetical protein